jgi:cytidylate kinase
MVTDGGFMFQEVEKKVKKEQIEELKQFAEYLGVDFEDYLEYLHPDVDFDDYSR